MQSNKEAHEIAHLYVDGALSRRELIRRARQMAGGVAAVSAALNAMGTPLQAQQVAPLCAEDLRVPEDAVDIYQEDVQFPGEESVLLGYWASPVPAPSGPLPTVLVIHENRGLNEHIRDVTRRVARAGFNALGIDLLSRFGGTAQFTDPQQQTAAYNRTTNAQRLSDLRKAIEYLRTLPEVRHDRIGSVGFCAGGANVWLLGTSGETMAANVVYYGTPVPVEQIANLTGPILCHYGERDRSLTSSSAVVVPELIRQNKTFGYFVWEGAGHAFNSDTGAAYNPTAACEAWTKTIDFFKRHLNKE